MAKPFLDSPKKQVVPCGGASIRYYMNAYGDVFPCVIWDNKIGSLRNNGYDFTKLMDSQKRYEIRRQIENNKCPICLITCELIPSMMAHPFRTMLAWL